MSKEQLWIHTHLPDKDLIKKHNPELVKFSEEELKTLSFELGKDGRWTVDKVKLKKLQDNKKKKK